jgi:nucleoside-diphosphate-sugar epimerase
MEGKAGAFFAGKRVLVAGGTGFIGRALCVELAKAGAKVFVTTRGKNPAFGTLFKDAHGIEPLSVDLFDAAQCAKALFGIDVVFNLVTVSEKDKSTERIVEENRSIQQNLLDAAMKNRVRRFVFASTLLINSFEADPEQQTSRFAYIRSKMEQERLLMKTAEKGFDAVICRIGNCYGPGFVESTQPTVVGAFVRRAVEQKPLSVFGDGTQKRSFVFVDDVADGLMCVAASDATGALDVTSDEVVSIRQLADRVMEITGTTVPLSFVPQDHVDVSEPVLDTEKTFGETGFKAAVSLSEGLKRTISWYKAQKRV